ncbi:hypothetical protein AB0I28_28330 [Phytomonospora sp. NPDC050363]
MPENNAGTPRPGCAGPVVSVAAAIVVGLLLVAALVVALVD